MNSKERIAAALMMKPVDKVPNAPFYEAPVCNYFGTPFRAAFLEDKAMAAAHIQAVEKYQLDWVLAGLGLIGGILPEALGCEVKYPEDVLPVIEDVAIHSSSDIERFADFNLHTRRMECFLKGISLLHEYFKDTVPVVTAVISPFTLASRLRGVNEIMLDIYQCPGSLHRLLEQLSTTVIELGKMLIDAGASYIFCAADMECPMLISPEHYKQFAYPYSKRVISELTKDDCGVLTHMCGDIVDAGIADLLLETECAGILPGNITQIEVLDIVRLKEKVGNRICIFDNLNPNGSLLTGTPEEVATETKAHLDRAKNINGYIFSSAGSMSHTTPLANFEAMNRTVLDYDRL